MLEYNNEKDKSSPSPMCLPQDVEKKQGDPEVVTKAPSKEVGSTLLTSK